uniref:Uncharacterized protein n=1 Tax=Arundo donax TaxID=35708 RepID=A0A0A9D7P4_ARUDO
MSLHSSSSCRLCKYSIHHFSTSELLSSIKMEQMIKVAR